LSTWSNPESPLSLAPDAPAASPRSRRPRKPQPRAERGPYRDDLAYLQDELDWIEARARRIASEVKLAKIGPDELFTLRSRHSREPEVTPDSLKRSAQLAGRREQEARRRIDARLILQRHAGPALALDRLCESAALDDFERTVLLLTAAPCFSRQFEETFGELDALGISNGLTVEVVFAFLELPFAERVRLRGRFGPKGRLVAGDLVKVEMGGRYTGPKDLLTAAVDITGRTFSYLLGETGLADEFLEFSSVEEPRVTLEQVVLPNEDKRRILSVVERHEKYLACRKEWGFDDVIRYGRGVLMLFHGKPGTGKTMMAHAIAHQLGKRILNVDIPTFVDNADAARFLPGLFREARLQNAMLFFDECEVLLASRRFGNALMSLLLTELERFEGVAVLATNTPEALDEALDRRILVKVRFRDPDRHARREIWRKHLPATAPLAADVDLDALADRYEMAGGYIKNAVLVAVADAVHSDGDRPQITMAALERAAKAQLTRIDEDETQLVLPNVRLTDVILPAALRAQVTELIAAARSRRTVLERWGIGAHLTYGKGVSALFHGEPGTGKTLCAEIMAAELGLTLYRINVANVVDKYIGETEKNLTRIFKEANSSQSLLLFDEADSLFAKRVDVKSSNDRFSNMEINVLLQLIERYEGLVVLTTNLKHGIDKAFERRLSFKINFPFPDADMRERIWRHLVPAEAPLAPDVDFERIAQAFELAGGSIKNSLVRAAYRAAAEDRAITLHDFAEAARRECAATGKLYRQLEEYDD